jgi:hypothetical protein
MDVRYHGWEYVVVALYVSFGIYFSRMTTDPLRNVISESRETLFTLHIELGTGYRSIRLNTRVDILSY